jgi:hypothetical protein
MDKKRVIFIALVLLAIALLIIFLFTTRDEPEPMALIPIEKINYAHSLAFSFRMVGDSPYRERYEDYIFPPRAQYWSLVTSRTQPEFSNFTDFYTELVFVHNRDQARDFPDNVIVAWPSGGPFRDVAREETFAQELAAWITVIANQSEEVINLEDFGLANPVTAADLFYNWENINALLRAFVSWVAGDLVNLANGQR